MVHPELADELDLILLLLRRHVARHGHRMVQASGRLDNLFVSMDEARHLLGVQGRVLREPSWKTPGWPDLASLEEELAQRRAARRPPEAAATPPGPWSLLRQRFGLDERQSRLLLAAVAPLLSVDCARLYTFAWADFTQKQPSVSFLAELVADDAAQVQPLVHELRDHRPLVRHQLVLTTDHPSWGAETPLLHRLVRVPDLVVAFLTGQLDSLPGQAVTPHPELLVPPRLRADLTAGLRQALADEGGRPRLLLVGPAGSGRRSLLETLLAEHPGTGLVTADLARLARDEGTFGRRLAEVCLQAALGRSLLLLDGDGLFDDPERLERLRPLLEAVLLDHRGPLALTTGHPVPRLHALLGSPLEICLPSLTTPQQREIWSRTLLPVAGAASGELAAGLASRFSLTPGQIHAAVADAHGRALLARRDEVAPRLTLTELTRAVRDRQVHALTAAAEPFVTTLTWADVVLPPSVLAAIREIEVHARLRERVFDEWGFRRKISYGRGLSCLFTGPPGTGKTMMAGILAQSIGLELYRVDLSQVASKWVGETEKNLRRVFDEAERAQVILLFDEADSLFSSRTEVKSATDRFANMEVNYLLQRMEQYDGTTILTTNFEASIDPAFKRRIRFKVAFPMPDAGERERLWRSMFPPEAQVEPGIAFDDLAREFEMSGGLIKNAVLRAAFYAVDQGRPIGQDDLWDAALAERQEMGMLVRDAR